MTTKRPDGSLRPQTRITMLLGTVIAVAVGAAAQDFQRKAHYLDFVEAENSSGFHAPEEALRILGESINFARKGQLELRPVK